MSKARDHGFCYIVHRHLLFK